MKRSLRTERALGAYADTVWRVCALSVRTHADAQDAFQETFARHLEKAPHFRTSEHEKAWLIRVATNVCKDMLKRAERSNASLEQEQERGGNALASSADVPGAAYSEVFDAMARLPRDQRASVYLSVVEGYTAAEIAAMLDAPENTVYSWISRGKRQLREMLS